MFLKLWDYMFELVEFLLGFGRAVIDIFNSPITELLARVGITGENIIGEFIYAFINTFMHDVTLTEFMLSSGIIIYLLIMLAKFVKDVFPDIT